MTELSMTSLAVFAQFLGPKQHYAMIIELVVSMMVHSGVLCFELC